MVFKITGAQGQAPPPLLGPQVGVSVTLGLKSEPFHTLFSFHIHMCHPHMYIFFPP